MRLIGSIIKLFIYLIVILIAAGAALFWFDTGSWLIQPLAERAGNFFLAPLRLELASVNGSIRNGYTLDGLKLISGDKELFTLNHASVSPDWNLILKGADGIPYIQNIDLQGVSSDLGKVLALVDHFTASSDTTIETAKTGTASGDKEASAFKLNPFNASIRDLHFGTDYANISLDVLALDDNGNLRLNTKIISRDNVLPLKTNARINFEPIEVISSDLFIGKKGTGRFSGKFDTLKGRLDLTALSLEELLKFAPPMDIKASGRFDGRIFLDTDSNNITNVSGVVSMPRANIMDIPLNFRLPFRYDGKNFAALDNAELNTSAAGLRLNASADLDSMNIRAKGGAQNISLGEIGAMFAPSAGLQGDGGWLNFDVDTVISGDVPDILAATKADINALVPVLEAAGINILQGMNAHVKLTPGETPKISLGGQAFGGKLFARGEAVQDSNGDIKPQAVVSLVNLDLNTAARAIPALRAASPSGRVTATARISENLDAEGTITSDRITASGVTITKLKAGLNYDNDNSTAGGRVTSGTLSTNGVTLSNLLADLNYDIKTNRAELENFRTNLGRGTITASGTAGLKDNTFSVKADAVNIDTQAIPQLKDIEGRYRLSAMASGRYTDINSIIASARFEGRNMAYAGTSIGNITLPATYADSKVNIPMATVSVPGGAVNFWGNADLKNTANPMLDLGASTGSINIANIMKDFGLENPSLPVSGIVRGNVSVKGPLKTALVNANLYAEDVKAGEIVSVQRAAVEADGDMNIVNIRRIYANLNDARVQGNGTININQNNIMDSHFDIFTELRRFDLKKNLAAMNVALPLSGIIDAYVVAQGTPASFGLDAKVSTIEYNNDVNFDDIRLKVRSPGTNHFLINTSAKVDTFRAEIDADVRKIGSIWKYQVETRPLDLATVMESKLVKMPGMAKGLASVSVKGDSSTNAPVNINASANEITVMDKIKIQDISIPAVYSTADNAITVKRGTALLSNGLITANANVDLKESKWDGRVEVEHLNFGKLAEPFMPMGQLVGSVDASVNMKGGFSVMKLNFANGKFETTPGYLHKIDILDKISNGKITFQKIKGTFFWNGQDLYLDPGTGARASNGEPLYRYFNISGPMGIPGKGLSLQCDGRFDLKILDQLLGAMKGLFQYMTGSIAQSVLRDAAGRILGVKSRDYQNVSFTLSNSWQKLGLDDLKITKSIEDFLPVNILNQDEEKQREETQFKMSLKFPTGPGNKSVEDERPEEQLKQQFIDNLFNIGW